MAAPKSLATKKLAGPKKPRLLIRTNLLVCAVILAGFLATSMLSYQANYNVSIRNIEQVSLLTSEGIYHQIASTFTKPISVSLTMANDSLLKGYLAREKSHLEDDSYLQTIREYLDGYRKKYGYDSVFLVSAATGRYYNFDGINRVMTRDKSENVWYYKLLDTAPEYALNVDNDEAAHNEVTVFVNCIIRDNGGHIVGVVGVGLRVGSLQSLLRQYKDAYDVQAFLVDGDGNIEISADHSGYEKVDLFADYDADVRSKVLGWDKSEAASSFWTENAQVDGGRDFLVTRYVPELSWHLVTLRDTALLTRSLRRQFYLSVAIIAVILVIVLLVITLVIRGFHRHITMLIEEQSDVFRRATEQLYDNIYEYNITRNRPVGYETEQYFRRLGLPADTRYDNMLQFIATEQIKEEFREGYLNTFARENVLRTFWRGRTKLRYEFLMREGERSYYWMRVDAYIFYRTEDQSVHMLTYRKNIDVEKRLELRMTELAETDEMTALFTKKATQRHIEQMLAEQPVGVFGFFIFDIDNFKQVNDRFGHAFGDQVIVAFVEIIRAHFRQQDIIGRIGGDEFAAFLPVPDATWVEKKARELTQALRAPYEAEGIRWEMSASIGVALSPRDGVTFDALYRHADVALYQTKERGKNGYTMYHA